MPLTVFANPRIEVVDPAAAGYWEGCLSVPGLRGYVERPQYVRVTYQDLRGTKHVLELKGFLATVFQHEFDHLDGVLYVDRMTDPTKLDVRRGVSALPVPGRRHVRDGLTDRPAYLTKHARLRRPGAD